MRFSTMMVLAFLASIFMMWRFSKYSRILLNRRKMAQEERDRYQAKAQVALGAAGGFLLLSLVCLVLAILFQ